MYQVLYIVDDKCKQNVCLKPENHFANLGVRGEVMMRWIFRKESVREWVRINWPKTGYFGRLCKFGNKL